MKLGMIAGLVLSATSAAAGEDQTADALPTLEVAFAENPAPDSRRWGPVGPFYPQVAVIRQRNGEVVIDCMMAATGALSKCTIVSETPPKHDFGFAALRMAELNYIGAPVGTPREPSRRRFFVPFKTLNPKFR